MCPSVELYVYRLSCTYISECTYIDTDVRIRTQAKATAKWGKRAEDIEKTRTDKAKKRAENIKTRTLDRRDKKMGPAPLQPREKGTVFNPGVLYPCRTNWAQ